MYDFLAETRNYSIFLAFIASSLRVTEEDWLSEADLSGPSSFFWMFSLLLKELIFIFLFNEIIDHNILYEHTNIFLINKKNQKYS